MVREFLFPARINFVGISTTMLRNLFPLTAFKNAPNPKFVQNLSQRLFLGVPVRGSKICKRIVKICLKTGIFRQNFDNFFQIFAPLTGTPKNNRFWTNLGFGAFLNAVRGEKGFATTMVLGTWKQSRQFHRLAVAWAGGILFLPGLQDSSQRAQENFRKIVTSHEGSSLQSKGALRHKNYNKTKISFFSKETDILYFPGH